MNEASPSSFPLLAITLEFIYKVILIVGLIVFSIFLLVLIQQIKSARDTLTVPLGPFFQILAYILFVASLALLFLAIVVI